jgi:putative redox protein
MNAIDSETERANEYPQTVRTRGHVFRSDMSIDSGGADVAPGPHDYFDAALATCKSLTAHWYATRHQIPLERVETHVERDAAQERAGIYHLRVRVQFHGALTDAQRAELRRAIDKCPIHRLMTTSDVQIEMVD